MPQFGGKNEKKTSSDSKRHFTVVMGNKEHGLYVSSTPSSAAKKAVTKLCAANKGKKVEFHIREITQGSKKKTYGPYVGYVEKLKEPIQLKGRVIKHKSVAKLSEKTGKKMRGGDEVSTKNALNAEIGNKTRELFEPEITKEIITKESLRENANKLAKNTQRLKNNLKSLYPNLNLESKNNGPKNASLPQSNGPQNTSLPQSNGPQNTSLPQSSQSLNLPNATNDNTWQTLDNKIKDLKKKQENASPANFAKISERITKLRSIQRNKTNKPEGVI